MKRVKDMILGSLVTLLMLSLTITVFASINRGITVTYADIKLNINGSIITPKDAAGNTVEPFIYNGTTYLPVRAVADALNSTVTWDQMTKTVTIIGGGSGTTIPTDPTTQKLIDVLPPYTGSTSSYYKFFPSTGSESISMGGVDYKNSLRILAYGREETASFNLNGRYTMLTGIIGTIDGNSENAVVSFIGDGNVLKTYEIVGGALPQDFSLDVTGVRQLTVKHHGNYAKDVGLAELMIK